MSVSSYSVKINSEQEAKFVDALIAIKKIEDEQYRRVAALSIIQYHMDDYYFVEQLRPEHMRIVDFDHCDRYAALYQQAVDLGVINV